MTMFLFLRFLWGMKRCARNEELVEALEKENYERKFPIYFTLLQKKFYDEVERQRLRKRAANVLSNIFEFNDAFHPVNKKILSFLGDQDLEYLKIDAAVMTNEL